MRKLLVSLLFLLPLVAKADLCVDPTTGRWANCVATSDPAALVHGLDLTGIAGDNDSSLRLYGTVSATGAIAASIRDTQIFQPTGAVNVNGIQLQPHLGVSTNDINNYEGFFVAAMTIDSDYTGATPAITQVEACNVWTDDRSGGTAANPVTAFRCFQADPITNAVADTTTGTVGNWQFYANGGSANAAATGVTVNNINYRADLPSGGSAASGAVTNNYGLLITGNGGTNVAGTTTNWAIDSTSTADSQLVGGLDNTPIGATTPAAGAFTTLSASGSLSLGSTVVSNGTAFTVSGCGSASSISGDATGGKFTCGTGATPATIVVTINGATGSTAAHLWVCVGSDTTSAVILPQSGSSSTTTCTMKGNVSTSDVVTFNVWPH